MLYSGVKFTVESSELRESRQVDTDLSTLDCQLSTALWKE
jgi:hypothetical protein